MEQCPFEGEGRINGACLGLVCRRFVDALLRSAEVILDDVKLLKEPDVLTVDIANLSLETNHGDELFSLVILLGNDHRNGPLVELDQIGQDIDLFLTVRDNGVESGDPRVVVLPIRFLMLICGLYLAIETLHEVQ